MTVIRLIEYQDGEWALDDQDARFIADTLNQQVRISRSLAGDRYRLNPRQFVGIVTLPSGRRLESIPKVPIQTLFRMLAVAFDLDAPFREEVTQLERLDEFFEFIVAHFATLVEGRIHRGLYRDYRDSQENLSVVRGRIAVADDVRQNFVFRHRTMCRFADFTWDVPENQIIRQVVHALSRSPLRPALRRHLWRLDGQLGEVRLTTLPVSVLDRMVYHRLNDDYRSIHQFCRLFLEGASLSERAGIIDFRTFLIDMNRLFEAFVTQALAERAPKGVTVAAQVPEFLGRDRTVRMRLDLLVRDRGQPVLVADCKYKRLTASAVHRQDVYQALAYCTATGVHRGSLIYPAHELSSFEDIAIRHSPVHIRQMGIALNVPPTELNESCDSLADSLWAWIRSAPALTG